jgi:hypothetical protein
MTVVGESLQMTRSMVDAFRTATKDHNKIHEEIALGFQLGFLIKDFADKYMKDLAPELSWSYQETRFENAVPIDAEVHAGQTGLNLISDPHVVVSLVDQTKTQCVSGMVKYYGPVPSGQRENAGREYTLTEEHARMVATGLGKEGTDIGALAIGLASNALLEDGKEIIEKHREEGKEPVYIRHKIRPYSALELLKPEDQIIISTNAAKFITFSQERMERLKGLYPAKVVATRPDGSLLYEVDMAITFIPREQVLKK